MTNAFPRPILGLLLACALAGCSGKHDTTQSATTTQAPAPVAPAPGTATQPAASPATVAASAAAASVARTATMKTTFDCDERAVVLEATCDADDSPLPECSRQTLAVVDRASGAIQSTREFDNRPETAGDPPQVEAKIGELRCVRAASGERYFVADMFNGGNCEECEWHELYDWNGALVGSDRDRKKPNATLKALLRDSADQPDTVIAKKSLVGFYGKPIAP